jgi:AcrR family transcriptional regulator
LFNEFGEPNITTTVIAEEMNISPGNLYYHFRNKDDIVNSIFVQFEAEIERILTVPDGRRSNIEDVWLYLHLMFELIWRYRFFYRDLNDLLSRNRKLELHFKQILAHKIKVAKQLCEDLRSEKSLEASDTAIDAMATNMVVVATYWLSYDMCAIRASTASSSRWPMRWRAAATRCCRRSARICATKPACCSRNCPKNI